MAIKKYQMSRHGHKELSSNGSIDWGELSCLSDVRRFMCSKNHKQFVYKSPKYSYKMSHSCEMSHSVIKLASFWASEVFHGWQICLSNSWIMRGRAVGMNTLVRVFCLILDKPSSTLRDILVGWPPFQLHPDLFYYVQLFLHGFLFGLAPAGCTEIVCCIAWTVKVCRGDQAW